MRRLRICTICCLMTLLVSCKGTPVESVTEVQNGAFKILVRSQEFHHSGSVNVDICVANTSSHNFPPESKSQCFLKGYDFSGLSAKWLGPRVIEVSFSSGRVSHFTNSAFAYPGGPIPEEFHIVLCDGCDTASKAYLPEGTAHP
jgi:hypothetical protein